MNEKGFEIIYSDKYLAVCKKPSGVSCEASGGANCMPSLIAEALSAEYVGTVHRLDTVTEGLMLYSLSERVTGKLSEAVAAHDTEKEYLAVVHGCPETAEGEMRDLLYRDAAKNKSYVVKRARRGVREAILGYRLIETADTELGVLSLVRIRLTTGRTHQIRVQFGSRAMPLLGDGKYGARDNSPRTALFSARLSFTHPITGKRMTFEKEPEGQPWELFGHLQNSSKNRE
jgi:23S rRNA pseudouridine1911/1915/1917 synthase